MHTAMDERMPSQPFTFRLGNLPKVVHLYFFICKCATICKQITSLVKSDQLLIVVEDSSQPFFEVLDKNYVMLPQGTS